MLAGLQIDISYEGPAHCILIQLPAGVFLILNPFKETRCKHVDIYAEKRLTAKL